MKIYLIGFMGSGKTAYGERLAKQLKWSFYDLDQLVVDQAGSSIHEIFQSKGEAHFRNLEQRTLHSTVAFTNAVIATGGGTPAYSDNMEWMNQNGETVYLKLLEDNLLKRLKKNQDSRPLIQGMKPDKLHQFISNKLKERSYYYLQAHRVIDPIEVQPGALAKALSEEWEG